MNRMTGEEFLQSKDIWNHPTLTDRNNKESYDVAELLEEYVSECEKDGELGNALCKRKPLSDDSLPLTKEEIEELTDMISIGMETVVLVEYVPNQFVWVTYSSGREESLSNIKAILWLAERFELTSNN